MAFGPLDNPLISQRVNYHLRLKRLISYMQAHPTKPLHLGEAAAVVCMEKTAFCKFFRRTVGITFHEFVQRWKIATAIEQMMASDCSITELAYALGFESVNTFGRTFKKVTHMTPSDYRKRILLDRRIIEPINGHKWPIIGDSLPRS